MCRLNGEKVLYKVNLNLGYDLYASPCIIYSRTISFMWNPIRWERDRRPSMVTTSGRSRPGCRLPRCWPPLPCCSWNKQKSNMSINQKKTKQGLQGDFLRIQDLFLPVSGLMEMVCPFVGRNAWHLCLLYFTSASGLYSYGIGVNQRGFAREIRIFGDGCVLWLGIIPVQKNVNNELIAFLSPALMTEEVKRLRLDMNYFVPRIFLSQVAYGLTLPVEVTVRDLLENESASFMLEVQPDSILFLSDFARSGTELDETSITGHLLDLTPPR